MAFAIQQDDFLHSANVAPLYDAHTVQDSVERVGGQGGSRESGGLKNDIDL